MASQDLENTGIVKTLQEVVLDLQVAVLADQSFEGYLVAGEDYYEGAH